MAGTISRLRVNNKPGKYVVRGAGAWTTSATTMDITGLPKGNIIGARFTPVFASMTVCTGIGIDGTISNGVLACNGTVSIVRSSGGDSAATFFWEIEYDSY